MAPADPADNVVLLTGATSGIGRIAAERFADRGWTVIGVGRNEAAGTSLEAFGETSPGSIDFHRIDLSHVDEVRALAEAVSSSYDRLDVLANNAGLSAGDWNKTPDGIELTMAVNHLAPYLLTHELIDELIETEGRIVTTASEAHRRSSFEGDDLWFEESFDSLEAYARSKLANISFTLELAGRLPAGPVANCFHPGFIPDTGLFRDAPVHIRLPVNLAAKAPFVGSQPADGAQRLLKLATAPAYGQRSGQYVTDAGASSPDSLATDESIREHIWGASAAILDIDPNWP